MSTHKFLVELFQRCFFHALRGGDSKKKFHSRIVLIHYGVEVQIRIVSQIICVILSVCTMNKLKRVELCSIIIEISSLIKLTSFSYKNNQFFKLSLYQKISAT